MIYILEVRGRQRVLQEYVKVERVWEPENTVEVDLPIVQTELIGIGLYGFLIMAIHRGKI